MIFNNLNLLKVCLQAARYMLLSVLLLVGFLNFTTAETESFIQALVEKAAEAEIQKTTVVSGKDGWFFFAPETTLYERWTILGRCSEARQSVHES